MWGRSAVSIGYGRAWEITQGTRLKDHDPLCAYQRTIGVLLCDCEVLTGHPEYTGSVVPAGG